MLVFELSGQVSGVVVRWLAVAFLLAIFLAYGAAPRSPTKMTLFTFPASGHPKKSLVGADVV
jgi:hypothetical protein